MSERPIPAWLQVAAYGALILLTFLTVMLSFLRLGEWHIVVGGAIGVLKVCLVALFFMHLIRSPGRIWMAAGLGLFWLGILIVLMMSDYYTRREAAF